MSHVQTAEISFTLTWNNTFIHAKDLFLYFLEGPDLLPGTLLESFEHL